MYRTLPACDDLAQGLHGFLERCLRIVAMALIQIDMADPQPRQGCVELLENLRARQPLIGAAHRKVELGCQNITVAANSRQRFAEDLLRGAAPVDIGGVDQVMPQSSARCTQAMALLFWAPFEKVSHEPKAISDTVSGLLPS